MHHPGLRPTNMLKKEKLMPHKDTTDVKLSTSIYTSIYEICKTDTLLFAQLLILLVVVGK